LALEFFLASLAAISSCMVIVCLVVVAAALGGASALGGAGAAAGVAAAAATFFSVVPLRIAANKGLSAPSSEPESGISVKKMY
jgi:hypothetical protein